MADSSKAPGTQRGHEQPGHRREYRDADDALLGIDRARQPRVADPRPPQGAEHEQALGQARPRRLVGHERGALREREDEDEVEEELERRDVRLFAQRRLEAAGAEEVAALTPSSSQLVMAASKGRS
jgi:hypothetical protein